MKKAILIALMLVCSGSVVASESSKLYKKIDGLDKVVSQAAFDYSYKAYLNAPKNCQSKYLTINDLTKSRFYRRSVVIDMSKLKLLESDYVAHGENTDDGKGNAVRFSNIDGSHMTSLGVYCTDDTYYGENGYSLRLDGLTKGFNDKARSRYIVIHGAKYVTERYAGRSYGCPAYSKKQAKKIINMIKGRSIVVIYAKPLEKA